MARYRLLTALALVAAAALTACGRPGAAPGTGQPAGTQGTQQQAQQPAGGGQAQGSQAASPQPAAQAPARRISIATGGTGGVYFVLGGGLAQVLTRHAGVEATAEVSNASVENLNFIAQKSADVAFTLADTAYDAVKGRGRFQNPLPLRALAVIYSNVTHIVVLADSPIQSVKDLKGKRVCTGAPNSGTEVIAERVLRASGIDPGKDITRERLDVANSAAALKDKKIDAFFWSGGVPTAAVLELASTPGVKIRLLSDADVVPSLVKEFGPLYVATTVPAGSYPNTPEAKVSGVPNLLVVHQDMPEDLAYRITRALFERKDDLVAVHKAAAALDPKAGATGAPMDYHPGAIKYYKEKGVWAGP